MAMHFFSWLIFASSLRTLALNWAASPLAPVNGAVRGSLPSLTDTFGCGCPWEWHISPPVTQCPQDVPVSSVGSYLY